MNKTIHISIREIILILCFISFYVPSSYAVPEIIYQIWRLSFVAVGIVAIFLLIFHSRRGKISSGYFAAIAYYTWIFIFPLLVSGTAEFRIYNYLRCIGLFSLLEYAFVHYKTRTVIKSFVIAGVIMSFIHFVSFLQYSNLTGGMRHGLSYYTAGRLIRDTRQNWYFLTYDNDSIYFFLPVIALLFCSVYHDHRRLKYWIVYIGFILYMYVVKIAATAVVAVVVLIGGYLWIYFKKSSLNSRLRYIKYKNAIVVGTIVAIVPIIIVGGELALNLATYFGKKATFSGRDVIWARSILQIFNHPFFGNGFEDAVLTWQKINQTHCHNIILENLYIGGAIGLALFYLMIFFYRPRKDNSKIAMVFTVSLFSCFLAGSMDWLTYNPIPLTILIFNYYISKAGSGKPEGAPVI